MGGSGSVLAPSNIGDESFADVVPQASNHRLAVVTSKPTQKIIHDQIRSLTDSVVKNMPLSSHRRLSTKPNSETSLSIPPILPSKQCETFMDSTYIQSWLSNEEADQLFHCLAAIGEAQRPKDTSIANRLHSKYPLWTKYYGLARKKDGARALDRWGSYHESWTRVSEPPAALAQCAERIRQHFNLPPEAKFVNSMVVNYYYDGQSTYIPAHRDTTACLQEDSTIFCLSLGATRDFILCGNSDAGKYSYDDFTHVEKKYSVSHGDLFALGAKTNESYCHCVPQESHIQHMRISVIFRSVDKSFIDLDGRNVQEKVAFYANGKEKVFSAECVTTTGYDDEGQREHIADLITTRERLKKEKKLILLEREQEAKNLREEKANNRVTSQDSSGGFVKLESYYMGRGLAVPQ
jgi:alkylated DNA repair dioxygenase AlkB